MMVMKTEEIGVASRTFRVQKAMGHYNLIHCNYTHTHIRTHIPQVTSTMIRSTFIVALRTHVTWRDHWHKLYCFTLSLY